MFFKIISSLLYLFSSAVCMAQNHFIGGDSSYTSSTYYEAEEYFIQYLPHWTLDTSGLLGTQFIVTSPKKNDEDPFRENVSLKIKDSKNLHNFIIDAEKSIKANGTLLESHRRINFSRQEYHLTVYTRNEQPDLVYEQYYFFKYWFIYELTCVYERKTFLQNRASCERVLDSFRFNYSWSY